MPKYVLSWSETTAEFDRPGFTKIVALKVLHCQLNPEKDHDQICLEFSSQCAVVMAPVISLYTNGYQHVVVNTKRVT